MKVQGVFASAIMIIGINVPIISQNVSVEVAKWYGFKDAAICYTFDDGCSNQFLKARPMFDSAGFPMTLFTVTNWASNWSVLKAMAENGHEIASHSVSHPNFGQINIENQDIELSKSKAIIEQKIGRPCLTHAYPYCVKSNDSLVKVNYLSARGCQGYIEKATPADYYNISSIIVGNLGAVKTYSDFKNYFKQAAVQKGWLVFLIHGIDNDGGYSPIPSSELQKSLLYLEPRTAKYWVTTFKAATLYSKERDAAQVTLISASDDQIELSIVDTLPDSLYNQSLTLRCILPQNWPSVVVKQNEQTVFSRIVKRDTSIFIEFDAVPDGGLVVLKKDNTPVVPEVDSIPPDEQDNLPSSIENSDIESLKVIAKKNKLTISWPANANARFWQVTIADSLGRIIISKNVYSSNAFTVDLPHRKKGVMYFIQVKSSAKVYQTKLVL
ncbi:MAG: polysaccharide deacetylase family protein [Bacteroidales bacterium]|nr:polysaccharide deacetylase family protein [Bacteroidales bacterium]